MLNRAKRASHLDPPASSYANWTRQGSSHESLTPDPELENSQGSFTSFPPSRRIRFAPRADVRPMPAFMSTGLVPGGHYHWCPVGTSTSARWAPQLVPGGHIRCASYLLSALSVI